MLCFTNDYYKVSYFKDVISSPGSPFKAGNDKEFFPNWDDVCCSMKIIQLSALLALLRKLDEEGRKRGLVEGLIQGPQQISFL